MSDMVHEQTPVERADSLRGKNIRLAVVIFAASIALALSVFMVRGYIG